MCGIAYIKRIDGKPARSLIKKRYQGQRSRGTEGFGFIASEKGKVTHYIRAEKEDEIFDALEQINAEEILFHHRFPTSTPNFKEAAHPIYVTHETLAFDYFVVHNGVIFNDKELKLDHEKKGFKYMTEIKKVWKLDGREIVDESKWNDSESLAIDLVLAIENNKSKLECRGSIAVICMQIDKTTGETTKLFYGRNYSNPLKVEIVKKHFIAITSAGCGNEIEANQLFTIDYKNPKVTNKRDFQFNAYGSSYNYDYSKNSGRSYGYRTDDEEPEDKKTTADVKKAEETKKLPTTIVEAIDQQKKEESELSEKYGNDAELEDTYWTLVDKEIELLDRIQANRNVYPRYNPKADLTELACIQKQMKEINAKRKILVG